jgi:hypothetical protein
MHVAKNLNLSFSDLQTKMTGSSKENLGKTIQDLGGPNVNASAIGCAGFAQQESHL